MVFRKKSLLILVSILGSVAAMLPALSFAATPGSCLSGMGTISFLNTPDGTTVTGGLNLVIRRVWTCNQPISYDIGRESVDNVHSCTDVTTRTHIGTGTGIGTTGNRLNRPSNTVSDANDYCIRATESTGVTPAVTDVFSIDNTPPTIIIGVWSNNVHAGQFAEIGDSVTLSISSVEPIALSNALIWGQSVSFTNSGYDYRASRIMTSGDSEGLIPISFVDGDFLGNNASFSMPGDAPATIYFSKNPPVLSGVTISSSNSHTGLAVIGDTITLQFTGSGITGVVINLGGATLFPLTGLASITVSTGQSDGPIPFSIDFVSLSGVPGVTVTGTTDGSSVTIDDTPPVLTITTGIPSSSNNTHPTLSFSSNEIGSVAYSGRLAGNITGVISGINVVSFWVLPLGNYNPSQIIVTDILGHSATLTIPAFSITTTSSSVTRSSWGGGGGGDSGVTTVAASTPAANFVFTPALTAILEKIRLLKPEIYPQIKAILIAKLSGQSLTSTVATPTVTSTSTSQTKAPVTTTPVKTTVASTTPVKTSSGTVSTTPAVTTSVTPAASTLPSIPSDFTFYRNYKVGEKSKEVKYLQTELTALGQYNGAIDSLMTKAMVTAIYNFQSNYNLLPPDADESIKGYMGANTRAVLNTELTRLRKQDRIQ